MGPPRDLPLVNSRAQFDGVAVGQPVRARWKPDGAPYFESERSASGEAWEDGSLAVLIHPARKVLTGRLVTSAGVPQRRAEVIARIRYPDTKIFVQGAASRRRDRTIVTDDHGRFRVPLLGTHEPGTTRRLMFRVLSGPLEFGVLPFATADLDFSRSFDDGEHSLGDIVVDDEPILVAGRVTDGAGMPVVGASVAIDTTVHAGRGRLGSTGRGVDEVKTDANGVYRLVEIDDPLGPMVVEASFDGLIPAIARDVTPGTEHLELVLAAGGAVMGRVILEREIDATGFFVRVIESDGTRHRTDVEANGSFRFGGLKQVSASLEVWGVGEEVATLDDVAVDRGGGAPPLEIDLRGRFRVLRLRVVDQQEVPRADALVNIAALDDVEVYTQKEADEEGAVDATLPVHVARFRIQTYESAARDIVWNSARQTVVLGGPLAVTIMIEDDLPAIAPPFKLELGLCPLSSTGERLSAVTVASGIVGSGGRTECSVAGPGSYAVDATLWVSAGGSASGQGIPVDDGTQLTIVDQATEQIIPLRLGAAAIEELRARLR